MHPREQTIFAQSSGRPPTAIAVIRVSGPQAGRALESLVGKLPPPRQATRATLTASKGEPIDDALVLWFPAPASATGEDVAEFHVHGGRAVIAAIFSALEKIESLRAAEPGEFTRRAFENGKLDLTEAEGLDDLIHADTDRQRRQALRQLKGLLGNRARDWREQIIAISATIEASIDFADEKDVPDDLIAPAKQKIQILSDDIESVLSIEGRGERLRDGLIVAIAGAPNVGKSTLLNRLAKRDVAIVSPQAGTTRDVIEVHLDLDGYAVTLIDTAGIHDASDPVEQEGIRRAQARAADADLVLWMIDGNSDEIEKAIRSSKIFWVLRNKIDDFTGVDSRPVSRDVPTHAISAKTGAGITELTDALVQFAGAHFEEDRSLITRARHRVLLTEAAAALKQAAAGELDQPELIAEHLRIAIHSLGRLVGRVDVEDVLGAIFAEFCIGK
jgi:tRNA modification GTPase